jgi:hypothetical protein
MDFDRQPNPFFSNMTPEAAKAMGQKIGLGITGLLAAILAVAMGLSAAL